MNMNLATTERNGTSNGAIDRWSALRPREPHELLEARADTTAVRLECNWELALRWLGSAGAVAAVTPGPAAVIEHHGVYSSWEKQGGQAHIDGGTFRVRATLSRWHVAFAVTTELADGPSRSLQFFAAGGAAVHRVYLMDERGREQFDRLLGVLISEAHPQSAPSDGRTFDSFSSPDATAMSRTRAFGSLGPDPAWRARVGSVCQSVLREAADTRLPLSLTVANSAVAQSHEYLIEAVSRAKGWLHVTGMDVRLRLWEASMASLWIVHGLKGGGVGPHLEIHDQSGALIARLGTRAGSSARDERRWRGILGAIERPDMMVGVASDRGSLNRD
jgi:putative hemin transport protein